MRTHGFNTETNIADRVYYWRGTIEKVFCRTAKMKHI